MTSARHPLRLGIWSSAAYMLRSALVGLTLAYGLLLALLAGLWLVAPTVAWWVALSNVVAPHLFTPLALLAPLALLLRARPLRLTVVLLLALFVLLFGWRLAPVSAPARAGEPALRVLTLNQHQYRPAARAGELAATILAQQADLVALQELSPEVAAVLSQQLAERYPYRLLDPAADDSGTGLFSRYPLQALGAARGFAAQQALLDVDGLPVLILNVHLVSPKLASGYPDSLPALELPLITGYDTTARDAEVAALLAAIERMPGALIVLGDFNLAEREPAYATLDARLHDAFRATAWGFGFTFPDTKRLLKIPYPYPLLRLDYIFSQQLTPLAAWRDCGRSKSDHCAVVAELALP